MKNTTIQTARIDLSNGPHVTCPIVGIDDHQLSIAWWPTDQSELALGFLTPMYPTDLFFQTKAEGQPFGPEHLDEYSVNHSTRIGDRCVILVHPTEVSTWTQAVIDRLRRVSKSGGAA